MFPSEMVILMAIAVTGDSGKKILARPMDVTGEYVGYLYDSLVKRGYLNGNKSRGYVLTSMGKETLLEFMHDNKNRANEAVNALQKLSIGFDHEMSKIKKEAIGVK